MSPELRLKLSRLRAILRSRSTLSEEDQQFLDENLQPAREELARVAKERVSVIREVLAERVLRIDLDSAYRQLTQVHPTIDVYETPSQVSEQIVHLDSLDAVAFDAARNALSVSAQYTSELKLWEAWWCEYSPEPTEDRSKTSFKVAFAEDFSALAQLEGFLTMYEVTQKRIGKAYEKLSRFFTAEADVWRTNGVQDKGGISR